MLEFIVILIIIIWILGSILKAALKGVAKGVTAILGAIVFISPIVMLFAFYFIGMNTFADASGLFDENLFLYVLAAAAVATLFAMLSKSSSAFALCSAFAMIISYVVLKYVTLPDIVIMLLPVIAILFAILIWPAVNHFLYMNDDSIKAYFREKTPFFNILSMIISGAVLAGYIFTIAN